MKKFALFFMWLCLATWTYAQELDVQVTINTPKLQTADPKVFQTFKTGLQEFLNNQRWTDVEYEQEERIEVILQITIDRELSATTFEGEISIQAVRPVYNSNYETSLFTHRDSEFKFTYQEYQPFDYNENSFDNNLTSFLAYYAYVIIGLDYDSFKPLGGTPYFQKAQEILNNVPTGIAADHLGWKPLDSKQNRYWLVENLLAPRVRPYREAMYNYHRLGLDAMSSDPNTGRAFIATAIETLKDVDKNYPNSMILQIFSNSKRPEIIEIFKPSSNAEKNKIVQAMTKIDPSKASHYQAIRKRG